MNTDIRFLWWRFTLREALLLGFFATFIVLTRAALRLHLSIPGHSMFFLVFFLLMSRASVPRAGATTLVGLISGLVCLMLGMAKMGPLILANFVLPAIIIDVAGSLYPRLVRNYPACLIVGMIAALSKNISSIGINYLMGMETDVMLRHAVITSLSGVLFGGAGALLAPPIVRKLQANKLIPSPPESKSRATAANKLPDGDKEQNP